MIRAVRCWQFSAMKEHDQNDAPPLRAFNKTIEQAATGSAVSEVDQPCRVRSDPGGRAQQSPRACRGDGITTATGGGGRSAGKRSMLKRCAVVSMGASLRLAVCPSGLAEPVSGFTRGYVIG